MSKNLTNAAVIEFDNEVKHVYQGMQTLRQTVTQRLNVVGESYKFTRMGKGVAKQKASQADGTPLDIAHNRQTCTLQDWYAGELTDIFNQAEVNFDERQELATTLARAIGRRDDQLIIDCMSSSTITYGSSGVFPTSADTGYLYDYSATGNFGMAILRNIRAHYQKLECEDDTHIVLQAAALQSLLDETEVGSVDYNSIKPLIEGNLKQKFMGFYFHIIGEREEGGLPGVTGDEIAYAYATPAIGYANGIDMKTTVDWVPMKNSWWSNCMLKAGAVAREPQAICKIIYDETA